MAWMTRLLLLVIGVGLAIALARMAPPSAGPQAKEVFKDDWPAPDEDSIEYVKGVDLQSLQTRDPGQLFPEHVDLFGNGLPPGGATVRLCYTGGVTKLAVSRDGQRIATAGPACSLRSVEIFDAGTGRCLRRMGSYRGIVEALAISADGRMLAVARSDFSGFKDLVGQVTIYDLETFEELCTLGEGTGPRALAFTPDGRLISGGGDGIVWLWDPETGESIQKIADLTRKVVALALSADGKSLATSSSDDVIRLWDLSSSTPIQQIDQPARALVYSPDGRYLATNRSVWDLSKGIELPRFRHEGNGTCLVFSPDGRTVAGYDQKGICLSELGTGQVRLLANLHENGYGAYVIAFGPSGRTVITGESYGEGLVWNITGIDGAPPALRASDLDGLMLSLTDGQAAPAYSAMWRLVAAGKDAVPRLAERLKQPLPIPIDDARLKKLLAELDSSDFHVRDRVTLELECLGREAEKALGALLKDAPPLEVRVRVEQILKRIADRGGKLPHELFRLRAVEVLENIGSPEAVQALEELAGKADPQLKQDMQQSLIRMKNRR